MYFFLQKSEVYTSYNIIPIDVVPSVPDKTIDITFTLQEKKT